MKSSIPLIPAPMDQRILALTELFRDGSFQARPTTSSIAHGRHRILLKNLCSSIFGCRFGVKLRLRWVLLLIAAHFGISPLHASACFLGDEGFEESLGDGTFPTAGFWQKAWLGEAGAVTSVVAARSGANGLWAYVGEPGSSWWSGTFQELPPVPGTVYRSSVSIQTPVAERWVDGARAFLRVRFLTAAGAQEFDSQVIGSPNSTWSKYDLVTPPVPDDILSVQLVLRVEKPEGTIGGAVANFDDVEVIAERRLGPPVIYCQPKPRLAIPGSNVSFSLLATGENPMTVTWFKDGQQVLGATGTTLTLSSIKSDSAGLYSAKIVNRLGQVSSDAVQLKLGAACSPIIEFTDLALFGTSGGVRGRVTGVEPTEFRVAIYIGFNGTWWWTKPLFSTPTVTIGSDGTWSAPIVTGGIDHRSTDIVALCLPVGYSPPTAAGAASVPTEAVRTAVAMVHATRNEGGIPLALLAKQPECRSSPRGGSVRFEVEVLGSGPIEYQWYRSNEALEGQDSAQLLLPAVADKDFGQYWVLISSPGGTVTSGRAELKFVAQIPFFVSIARDGTDLILRWPTVPQSVYQVQSKFGIQEFSWANLGQPIEAVSDTIETRRPLPDGSNMRLYRVILKP